MAERDQAIAERDVAAAERDGRWLSETPSLPSGTS